MARLRALLVDVGGVLIDERTIPNWDQEVIVGRLREAFGEDLPWLGSVAALRIPETAPPDWRQPTWGLLAGIVGRQGVTLADEDFVRVCRALAPPWAGVVTLEPGAVEAMHEARGLDLRLAICSNTLVRTAFEYRQDMATWGMDRCFDAYIASQDIGFGKPHPAMFEAALAALGVEPGEAAMLGDRPDRDIVGAHQLGIRTIWKRPPGFAGTCTPEPDAEIVSLHELGPLLRSWLDLSGRP